MSASDISEATLSAGTIVSLVVLSASVSWWLFDSVFVSVALVSCDSDSSSSSDSSVDWLVSLLRDSGVCH